MVCADAPELLKMRREIAANPGLSPSVVKSLLDCIDGIRKAHDPDDETCCACWQKARREADRVAA